MSDDEALNIICRRSRGCGPSSSGGGHGRSSGRGGGKGGRGKKTEASKAADKARLATLLAARKEVERAGGSWDPVRGCAKDNNSPAAPDEDEVECMGESSRAEAEAARDAAAQEVAVNIDANDDNA